MVTVRKYKTIWLALAFSLLVFVAVRALPEIKAYYWKAENSSVTLNNCSSVECEIHGTLRRQPWTDQYTITRKDRSEVSFRKDEIVKLVTSPPIN